MSKVFDLVVEVVFELIKDKEVWYLFFFGVYYLKKLEKIRGVFDLLVEFNGMFLNKIFIIGFNFINNLQGILIRFRKEKCVIVVDIEQMFYFFLVREDYRDYLRFFWYKDNDVDVFLIEYRMKVYAFGNLFLFVVVIYGFRKCV